MTHCVIDGNRCSKCCEVLTVKETSNLRVWQKYVRRYGYPEDFKPELKIHHMLRKISKRRAKKLNPRLVKTIKNNQSYFTCKNFNGSGCADYENRPSMCSDYPYYGLSRKEWLESDQYKRGGLYHIECTFFTDEDSE